MVYHAKKAKGKDDRIRVCQNTADGKRLMWSICPKPNVHCARVKMVLSPTGWRNAKFHTEELMSVLQNAPNPPNEQVLSGEIAEVRAYMENYIKTAPQSDNFFESKASPVPAEVKHEPKAEVPQPQPASAGPKEGTPAASVAPNPAPAQAPAPAAEPVAPAPAPAPEVPVENPAKDTLYAERANARYEAWTYSDGNKVQVMKTLDKAKIEAWAKKHGYKLVWVNPPTENPPPTKHEIAMGTETENMYRYVTFNVFQMQALDEQTRWFVTNVIFGEHRPYSVGMVEETGQMYAGLGPVNGYAADLIDKHLTKLGVQHATTAKAIDASFFAPPKKMKMESAKKEIEAMCEGSEYMFPEQAESEYDTCRELARKVAKAEREKDMSDEDFEESVNFIADDLFTHYRECTDSEFHKTKTAQGYSEDEIQAMFDGLMDIEAPPGSYKAEEGETENPPSGPIYSITDVEVLVGKLKTELKAPLVNAYASTLGGAERVSVLLMIAMDPKDQWENGILENSYYGKYHISRNGTMEHISGPMRLRKTHAKSIQDVVDKFNKLIAAPRQNPPTKENPSVANKALCTWHIGSWRIFDNQSKIPQVEDTSTGVVDHPVQLPDKSVMYESPEQIPTYVKNAVVEFLQPRQAPPAHNWTQDEGGFEQCALCKQIRFPAKHARKAYTDTAHQRYQRYGMRARPSSNPPEADNPLGEYYEGLPDDTVLADVIGIFAKNKPMDALTVMKEKYGAEFTWSDHSWWSEIWHHEAAGQSGGGDLSYMFCHLYQNPVQPRLLVFCWGRIGNTANYKIVLPAKNPPDAENPETLTQKIDDVLHPWATTEDQLGIENPTGLLVYKRKAVDEKWRLALNSESAEKAAEKSDALRTLGYKTKVMKSDYVSAWLHPDGSPPLRHKIQHLGTMGLKHETVTENPPAEAENPTHDYRQAAIKFITSENWQDSNEAKMYFMDDRSHGDEQAADAAKQIAQEFGLSPYMGNDIPPIKGDDLIGFVQAILERRDTIERWESNPPSDAGKRPPRPTPAPAAENPRKKKQDLGGSIVPVESIPDPVPRFHGKSLARCVECSRKVTLEINSKYLPVEYANRRVAICRVHGAMLSVFLVDKDKTDVYATRSVIEPGDIEVFGPFFTSAAKLKNHLQNVVLMEGEKYTPEEIESVVAVFEATEKSGNWDAWGEATLGGIIHKIYDRLNANIKPNPPVEVPVIDGSTSEADRELIDLEENSAEAKLNPTVPDPSLCGRCFKPVDASQRYLQGETSGTKFHIDCDPRKAKENPPDAKKCGVCGDVVQ